MPGSGPRRWPRLNRLSFFPGRRQPVRAWMLTALSRPLHRPTAPTSSPSLPCGASTQSGWEGAAQAQLASAARCCTTHPLCWPA
eukprot:11159296-Lingulodinium_polyedra.AAC.1